jgi:FtsP/CotA-like multicopper oxidase with cupredoxin domain
MNKVISKAKAGLRALLLLPLITVGAVAHAAIQGIPGPSFDLTAKADYITTGDGNSVLMWGYAHGAGPMSYPGPTLIVNVGDDVTVTLSNQLPVTVSMLFPGQTGVKALGSDGVLTQEATPNGGVATYTFKASNPGTYQYYSGSNPAVQIEMGLVGTLIVRPVAPSQAYEHAGSRYDREYLVMLTESDRRVHEQIAALTALGQLSDATIQTIDLTDYHATLWFINGRNAPDSMMQDFAPWMPTQPYGSLIRMFPAEDILIRVVGGGRDMHPFHTHGNHFRQIAQDGRLLESTPGAGPDLQRSDYTLRTVPGETYDILFTWTGRDIGWDIYGTAPLNPHTCTPDVSGFDATTKEWCADHYKTIPVSLPQQQDMLVGGFWGGSPYMGVFGALAPGDGGLNPNFGYTYMWHSHNEVELTNDDIFPGGIMTMLVIEPRNPGVVIP